ncbi:MAG: uridine diphosphate-N-acetylglucosamine-binding protein YvcK [Nitriliruptorales bacterium]|nr:uridine diphosphate-N-acetylglucosamine-binding protein YvcK [Nitriliruptorales bacterium]
MTANLGRVVAIGGGHGLARTLRAVRDVAAHVTAIVTVADDGGSSGRLREQYGVLPPGDLRMALAALSRRPERVALLQRRFEGGDLDGHAIGNVLLLGLLAAADGDLVQALAEAAEIVDAAGVVLPCATEPMTLAADTKDGRVIGQVAVARSRDIRRVELLPHPPPAVPDAIAAVAHADLVVLGPGSIFTSILPNLLVPDLAASVAASRAPVVLVGNLWEQPGETQGLTLSDHVAALRRHVPDLRLDLLLADDDPRGLAVPDGDDVGCPVITAAVRAPGGGHDPARLAPALVDAVATIPV